MMKNVFTASAALAAILGLTFGSRLCAKPADLPVDNQIECSACQESSGPGESVGKTKTGQAATETSIDTIAPTMAAICLEKWLQAITECQPGQLATILRNTPYVRWFYVDPAVLQEVQANQLFRLAEVCRRNGEYARARAYYQHVHLLTPTSRQGQLAIDRLVEIEQRMRESEESEVPLRSDSPGQSFREIRDRTIPLGLVEVTY